MPPRRVGRPAACLAAGSAALAAWPKAFALAPAVRGQTASSVHAQRPGAAAAARTAVLAGSCGVAFGGLLTVATAATAAASVRGGQRSIRRMAAGTEELPEPPEVPEEYPPAVIIGGGRLGEAFANMGLGQDIIVRRGDPFPADAPEGPIYVCTRNDDLKGVISMVPESRRDDLVFVQNGALLPFLQEELGPTSPVTVLLVYFAVAKKGEPPLDGKTDTDPRGLSAVNANGKWSREVRWRLTTSSLACRLLREPHFTQAYWEKNIWIAAYMLVGALHEGCKVVDDLIQQLATAVSAADPEVRWDQMLLCDRLAAYARSVAHFPTAVKEFEWRNGVFYDITKRAEAAGRPDPCPAHTAGLKAVGVIPS
eukprot:gb/GFBE01054921.1/.p1 GENE.gb/GFBE01054921.1/~~gb/GFBE01054921.1/.p1  ORF type:complete len:367 (+),score=59.85 gb/GFBE01054921.1/:1-1101(+)